MSTHSDQPAGPKRDRKGIPRWAKVLGIVVAILVLVILLMMTLMGRSGHVPPRLSAPSLDFSIGETNPASEL